MIIQKSLATALITAASVVGLVALLYALLITSWSVTNPVGGSFSFTAAVAMPETNEIAGLSGLGGSRVSHDTALVEGFEPLILPRVLTGVATALPFATVIAGCLGVIALTRRLVGQRPFARTGQVFLAVIAGLSLVGSVVIPWFTALAAEVALTELGLPSSGEAPSAAGSWLVAGHYSPLQDTDWPMLALGVVLGLVAMLWARGVRLQRDSEGLI
ncbi:hypothetical protein JSO19_02715 [Leucobacter sp. UCMA 4100]|uniref:hypothetical protein n=1 Tax=Leucobacter sp. UCMA 4100 TaxID=2810534 RepID=UPI0022EABAB6|nr:hypothetical protein [Leucobacter sp. UCMA 4100]MDA3146289.1 hypothetical protein [Leucobacter sp. UCMA 4100]